MVDPASNRRFVPKAGSLKPDSLGVMAGAAFTGHAAQSERVHPKAARSWRWESLALALLLAAAPAWTLAAAEKVKLPGIKGEDDRVLVDPTLYPWRAIGRVNRRSGGHCTGALVGPDKVLTAAHCLWNKRTGAWLKPESLHFVAGYAKGKFVAETKVSAVTVAAGAVADKAGEFRPETDVALLTLAEPIGKRLGSFALGGAVAPGAVLVHAGYSQDKAHALTVHDGCRVLGAAGTALLRHDCDATKGDSGAPLLMRQADRFMIVGVHVASTKNSAAVEGIAIASPHLKGLVPIN